MHGDNDYCKSFINKVNNSIVLIISIIAREIVDIRTHMLFCCVLDSGQPFSSPSSADDDLLEPSLRRFLVLCHQSVRSLR